MSYLPIQEVLHYVNEARTNPKKFASYVQDDIDSFIDNGHMPLFPGCLYSVNQSKQTWVDCQNFLLSQPPLPPYKISEALNVTAKDHATDMVQNNVQGHVSSDGSSLTDRLQRRCGQIQSGAWAENIGSQFDVDGRDHTLKTVLGLIIDDGVPSRGHRKNIFNPDYKYIGIHSKLKGDKIKTVMNFTSTLLNLADKNAEDDAPQIKKPGFQKKKVNPHKNNKNVHQLGGFKPQGFQNFQQFHNQSSGNNNQQQQGFGGFPQQWNSFNMGSQGNQNGERYKVSTSTRSSTETRNGKTITKVVETIQYSDGTTEQNEKIHTS